MTHSASGLLESRPDLSGMIDVLTALVNTGVGRAGAALSELTESRIELSVPSVRIARIATAQPRIPNLDESTATIVVQEFSGDLSGRSALAFPAEIGLCLASILSGVEAVESEMDIELHGVLLEMGNILLNSVMGTLADQAGLSLTYSLPTVHSGSDALPNLLGNSRTPVEELLVADVQFQVLSREICGTVLIVFQYGSVLRLARLARNPDQE